MRIPDSPKLEAVSDDIDKVNVLKGKLYSEQPVFDSEKDKTKFRQYEEACDRVKDFYKEQHEKQTMQFNIDARVKFRKSVRARMGIWEAMEKLNTLVDDSDPDTDVSQIEHLLQTAEAMRRDGKPEWMQVIGLVHDLGKLLYIFGSQYVLAPYPIRGSYLCTLLFLRGQWDVVGDTFGKPEACSSRRQRTTYAQIVVGCEFSDKIIYPDTFAGNPDSKDALYSTAYGIYQPNCGLENIMLSWGHDEYLYLVLKNQCTLPPEGLAMIRYHSFYPWHREGAYQHLTCPADKAALDAVRAFNPYDLYSKSDDPVDPEALKPYYMALIDKFFPEIIEW
ncbi:DUF706-domain-containing protein [Lyophyllum atratum]|nr:DUF706-domain-containing protein [Lyophyllum atratum]